MKHHITLLIFLLLGVFAANANVEISGKVTDDRDDPIEFATVRVQGTAIGTNTNLKGEYVLSVADRDTLVVEVSCLGYANVVRQYIKPKGKIVLNANRSDAVDRCTSSTPYSRCVGRKCGSGTFYDGWCEFEERDEYAIYGAWRIV